MLNKSGIERQTVQELAHGIETPLSHLGVENRSSPTITLRLSEGANRGPITQSIFCVSTRRGCRRDF